MVWIGKLLLLGAAAVGALPAPGPALHQEQSVVSRAAIPANAVAGGWLPSTHENVGEDLDKRQTQVPGIGRRTIQWAPQGRILFLLSAQLPLGLMDGLHAGQGIIGEGLLKNFQDWLQPQVTSRFRAFALFHLAQKGGVFGVGAGPVNDVFGFAFQTATFPDAGDLQNLLDAVYAWASEIGGAVVVTARPNNFFDLAKIGAIPSKRHVSGLEERSRGNTCPADTDFMKYATEDVPDLDPNVNIRWAGECDP